VEAGWFEKGVQYLSLGYDRLSGHFDRDIPIDVIFSELTDILDKIYFDYVFFVGGEASVIPFIRFFYEHGINTVHVGSGLRRYNNTLKDFTYQIIDRFSTIHFTYSPIHTKNLLNEGFDPVRIKLIGYPIIDLVEAKSREALTKSSILDEIDVEEEDYLLLLLWNKESFRYIDEFIKFSELSGEYLICPTPKWGKRILMDMDKYYSIMERYDVTFLESMDVFDHLALIMNSKSVITDVEWIYVEASLLDRPTLLIIREGEYPVILDGTNINYSVLSSGLGGEIYRKYKLRSGTNIRRFLDTSLMRERIEDTLKSFRDKFFVNELFVYTRVEGKLKRFPIDIIPDYLKGLVL